MARICPTSNLVLLDELNYSSDAMPDTICQFHLELADDPIAQTVVAERKDLIRIEAKSLPKQLVTLDLSVNRLERFPKMKAPTLQDLYLDYNPIKSFQDIAMPESLLTLTINGTKITSIDGVEFPDGMTSLDISENDIASMQNVSASSLISLGLKKMKVQPLRLGEFQFPDNQMTLYLQTNPGIRFDHARFPAGSSLHLDECNLSSIDGIPFPKNMKEISLANNNFTRFPQFPQEQDKIQSLNLGHNHLSSFNNVTLPPNLKELYLHANPFTDIRGVAFPDTLQILNFYNCPLKHLEVSERVFNSWRQVNNHFDFQWNGTLSSMHCENGAQLRAIRPEFDFIKVCVLNDSKWDQLYPVKVSEQKDVSRVAQPSATTPSPPNASEYGSGDGGGDGGSLIHIILVCAAAVTVMIAFIVWKRTKHMKVKIESPDSFAPQSETYDFLSMTPEYHGSDIQLQLWSDPVVQSAKIPLRLVRQHALLGRGGCGEVYRGTYKDQPVAIKRLFAEHRKSVEHIESLMSEVKLMASMDHANIVGFIGVAWETLSDLCIVVEYMSVGDLRSLLRKFKKDGRPKGLSDDKLRIARDVANGLAYLHSLQPVVLHRDLKSRNVLLNEQFEAKLTDFGVSRHRSDATMTARVGTSLWMAPEVMMGRRYNEKADIYSFGVVLSELDTHEYPYMEYTTDRSGKTVSDAILLHQVALGKICVRFSECSSLRVIELASSCLSLVPADRPSAAELARSLDGLLGDSEALSCS